MENISSDLIEDKVSIIIRQTDYSYDIAREKLKQFDYNEILVIKDYFGITEKKTTQIKSVNQEIYKQLRHHLDSSMRDYRDRVDKGEAKKVI